MTLRKPYSTLALNHCSSSFCKVGSRIVREAGVNCTKDFNSTLYHMFCNLNNNYTGDPDSAGPDDYTCDDYFNVNEAGMSQGIRGLHSGVFFENIPSKYHDSGDAISDKDSTESEYNLGGKPKMGYITTDIYTTFTILVGIFFPSCTGKENFSALFREKFPSSFLLSPPIDRVSLSPIINFLSSPGQALWPVLTALATWQTRKSLSPSELYWPS